MTPSAYLAFLSWQGLPVFLRDFARLRDLRLEDPLSFHKAASHAKTKAFISQNPLWIKKAESDFNMTLQKGYRIAYPGSKDYPKAFLLLDDAPALIHFQGEIQFKNLLPVTMVGSRKVSETVLQWMDFYLPKVIQEQNVLAVSGGARGVDQKAHSIALRLHKPTVCFLPSGLDHIYPRSLEPMKTDILRAGGGLLSCFAPWANIRRAFFHERNRMMACFSSCALIFQAALRSGSMLTARKALDLSRPVAALPGPPLSPLFTGSLQLLYDGALLLRDGLDLSLFLQSLQNERRII